MSLMVPFSKILQPQKYSQPILHQRLPDYTQRSADLRSQLPTLAQSPAEPTIMLSRKLTRFVMAFCRIIGSARHRYLLINDALPIYFSLKCVNIVTFPFTSVPFYFSFFPFFFFLIFRTTLRIRTVTRTKITRMTRQIRTIITANLFGFFIRLIIFLLSSTTLRPCVVA